MQLDEVTAVIRPRGPWEALDLGFALARRWFAPLWALWWLTAFPAGALWMLLVGDRPDLWLFLAWWFKPVFEAPLVYWLSRRLFGERPGVGDLWRARRQVLPLRLLPNLLWRRLHPSRSFQLPLLLLERLGGAARRRRQEVLQGGGSTAAWLTIICLHLESILWISALLLAAFLVPHELPGLDVGAALTQPGSAPYWVSTLLYWLAMSVIAPFYVAAGFAYYLARRTELEAWDLEIVFRRAAPRSRQHRRPAVAPTLLVLAGILTFLQAPPSEAQTLSHEDARALIGEVLAGEDFGTRREVVRWVYVGAENGDEEGDWEPPTWLVEVARALARAADLAAGPLKWGLILFACVLAALLLRRILLDLPRHRGPGKEIAAVRIPGQQALGTLAATPMPADVHAAVRALIASGDLRRALALLYAASLALLQGRHRLEIPESATELECLALVRRTRPPAEAALMERLVRAWLRLAYAHRSPEPAELDGLLRDWQVWEGGGHGG